MKILGKMYDRQNARKVELRLAGASGQREIGKGLIALNTEA
jgi:hypothetical protein